MNQFNKMKKNIFPRFIAEVSANHCGSIDRAKKIILQSHKYGADAVKIQTYEPESMTFNILSKKYKIKSGLWKNKYLWDLYNSAQTPYSWHKELFKFAKNNNILLFSTPFDIRGLNILEKLKCPLYKISSFEMSDMTLLNEIGSLKKPIIMSTGTHSLKEIEFSFNFLLKKNVPQNKIALLYCVSNYPSKNSDFNLNNIRILKNKFNCKVGLSDHSKDPNIAYSSILAGAEIIEKHVALNNQLIGPDIKFSLRGKEIFNFKKNIDNAFGLLGKNDFVQKDKKNKIFTRSLFAKKNINIGDLLNKENIISLRPCLGLESINYFKIYNKKSPLKINKLQPIPRSIIKKF